MGQNTSSPTFCFTQAQNMAIPKALSKQLPKNIASHETISPSSTQKDSEALDTSKTAFCYTKITHCTAQPCLAGRHRYFWATSQELNSPDTNSDQVSFFTPAGIQQLPRMASRVLSAGLALIWAHNLRLSLPSPTPEVSAYSCTRYPFIPRQWVTQQRRE